jgi:hypothetical protein
MAENGGNRSWVMVNRAPVLTLWAAVVAEVLGKGTLLKISIICPPKILTLKIGGIEEADVSCQGGRRFKVNLLVIPKRGGKSEQVFEHDFWSLEETNLRQRRVGKEAGNTMFDIVNAYTRRHSLRDYRRRRIIARSRRKNIGDGGRELGGYPLPVPSFQAV